MQYSSERTLESVVHKTLTDVAQQGSYPMTVDPAYIRGVSEDLAEEIRGMVTGLISTLIDLDGIAMDWNEAASEAIRLVEEKL